MDSDAEWVDVNILLGKGDPYPTPRPPVVAPPPGPATQRPHDSPEVERTPPPISNTAAIVGGAVGGVLGVAMLLLVLYLLTLRRRLSKAMERGRAGAYQLRVEDVAHLSHLDQSANTYLNTTDLQRLVSSVRASQKRLPTPPRIQHQTPKPYRPAPPRPQENEGFRSDVVVVRAPMPLPSPAAGGAFVGACGPAPDQAQEEAIYSNVGEVLTPPAQAQAPRTAPPLTVPTSSEAASAPDEGPASPARPVLRPHFMPKGEPAWKPTPPANLKPTPPANPKPTPPPNPKPTPPPNPKPTPPANPKPTPPANSKPTPPPNPKPTPPANPKPTPPPNPKPTPPANPKPTPPPNPKPTPPPVASKPSRGRAAPAPPAAGSHPRPGLRGKGRGLPPLKVPLLPPSGRGWREVSSCSSTPDTSIIQLTPESPRRTAAPQNAPAPPKWPPQPTAPRT